MQFDHEESSEERRRRQRDYHAFLDAQVEARRKAPPPAREDVEPARLPILPPSGRQKHQPNPPLHGADANLTFAKYGDMSRLQALRGADNSGGGGGGGGGAGLAGNLDRADSSYQGEYLHKLEQRLETEVQRRGMLERKVGTLGQKLQNWMTDSTASISSLGARDAAVKEVCEQARHLDAELARVQERQNRIEAALSLAPKVQEMTQQQVKALEEEARTRIQADEVRSARFRQAVERVSDEVQSLAARVGSEENGTSQRVAMLEAALTGEAKGTREATKQLGEHVKALGAAYSGSQTNMDALCQSLRRLEARQEEQQAFAGGVTEQLALRQQTQESLTTATSEKLDALKTSLANELSGMMTDTAKRVVESANVPQAITLLRGRVEMTEERLANMADKSFRPLEEELVGLRAEVTRLGRQVDADPAAADLAALGSSVTTAQDKTQTQLRELQDTLSAEITARRRNALRLAEAQAASKEGGRESVVQMASGLRARCLELEELVARLTQDIRTAQEELSSQTQAQLSATQERNSRAVGKLEESLTGIRRLVAQQDADQERIWTKSSARADELEALIADTKDSLREADERSRSALAAMEARRQAQGQQLLDKLATSKSEEMARTDAVEHALGEHRHATREAMETGYRANKTRADELHAEMKHLEERLTATVEDAQMKESGRVEASIHKIQEQITREMSRVRQATDRVAADTNALRVQVSAEETSRIDDVQSLQRDISKMTEASESRVRLWAEGRLQSERATTEEVLERAQAQSGMVRTLLDEAVSAISKELNMQKTESKARSVALEKLLDELVSGLEARLTEVDKGAAKKRRLGDLSKETGARIGEIERRVRQAEQELKDDLEVKLAVSSLVCTVSDKVSTQRLDQRASEELKLEKKRKMRETTNEGKLTAELGKTNAKVSTLQADLGAATAWRKGVDDLESKLMARIEELKAMAEAAKSAAATATADAAAARTAEAEATLAREEAAAELARAKEAEASVATGGDTGAQGRPAKKAVPKKVTDFAAMNDELEADDSSTSSSSPEDEQTDSDKNGDGGSNLKPRVGRIEEELNELKLRLEEGIADMAALRQEMIAVMSTRPPPSSGNDGGKTGGVGGRTQAKRSSGEVAGRREKRKATFTTSPRSVGSESAEETDADEERQGGTRSTSNTPLMSPKSNDSYTPPLSPALNIVRAPPLSPSSGLSPAVTAQRGGDATDASETRSERAAKLFESDSDSERESNIDDSEAEGGHSRRSSRASFTTASETEHAAGRSAAEESDGDEESDASRDGAASMRSRTASEAGSASNYDDDSGGDDDDGSEVQAEEDGGGDEEEGGEEGERDEEASDGEEEGDSDHDDASVRGSVPGSERSDEESDEDDDGGGGVSDAFAKKTNPESSSASEDERGASEGEGSDSMSEPDRPESQRSSSDDEGSTGRRKP